SLRVPFGYPCLRATQMIVLAPRQRKEREWRTGRFSCSNGIDQFADFVAQILPTAQMHFCMKSRAFGALKIGLDRQRLIVCGKRFAIPLETEIDIAAAKPGACQIRLDRQSLVVRSRRFIIALESVEDVAPPDPGILRVGP